MVTSPDSCPTGAARQAELDAVVAGRVVAGGEHRAGDVERARRRSRAGRWSRARPRRRRRLGRARPRRTPADSGTDEGRMSWAVTTVVAPLSPATNSADGGGRSPRDVLVPTGRDHSPHVVGLEDRTQIRHCHPHLDCRACPPGPASLKDRPAPHPRTPAVGCRTGSGEQPGAGARSVEVGQDPVGARGGCRGRRRPGRAGARAGGLADGVGQGEQVVPRRAGVLEVDLVRTTSQPRGTVSRSAWNSQRS
jgi:hypothetical protein